jgi:hypothetical protein
MVAATSAHRRTESRRNTMSNDNNEVDEVEGHIGKMKIEEDDAEGHTLKRK